MIRRRFLERMAFGSAGGLAAGLQAGGTTRTVTWRMEGFTCPTCPVGLEVMLREQKGVVRASAGYRPPIATIEFDPGLTSISALRAFVTELGFKATEANPPAPTHS